MKMENMPLDIENVAIDLGTRYVKTSTGLIFSSGISTELTEAATNTITINDVVYAMELESDSATWDMNLNKVVNVNLFQCYVYALTRICQSIFTYNVTFNNVAVALPSAVWKDSEAVADLKAKLDLTKGISVELKGVKYNVKVNNIVVTSEGAGAYYMTDFEKFEGKLVILIDWGSLTVNSIKFQNDDIAECNTITKGIMNIKKNVCEAVSSKTKTPIIPENVDDMMRTGTHYYDGILHDVSEIIRVAVAKDCEEIRKHLEGLWQIGGYQNVIMCGGGSILMHPYFKNHVKSAVLLPDAQILAVKGMAKMMEV